jgi:protocatechuate 3,4-dioxygenase beta subunit
MNRNNFLSLLSAPFLGLLLFSPKTREKTNMLTACDDPITPPVPEGPFYKNEKLNRANITEHKKGTPVEYIFRVEDKNCKPIEGAVVNIWQCDADGHYSDFKQENTLNQTWLRGFQKTNKNGACKFKAIFPGWYTGRLTHLHVKVYVEGQPTLTTNLFFVKEIENKIHQQPLYSKGPNPTTITEDFELKGDKDTKRRDTLIMTVTHNSIGELTGQYKFSIV